MASIPSKQTVDTDATRPVVTHRDGESHVHPGFDFASLISGLDVIIWEADAKTWQFTYVSSRAEDILGYPATQWFTEPHFWANHIHPSDRDRVVQFCTQATAKGKDHEFEYRAVARDGRIVWLHDIVRVIKDAAGQPCTLRGVMVDITDRKRAEEDRMRAEEALQASEEKFRTLVETANDAIIMADVEGNILEFNSGAERMFGYRKAEVLGYPLSLLIPERLRHNYLRRLDRYLRTKEAQVLGKPFEFPALRRDGAESPIQFSLASWTTKQGRFVTAVLRDITERRQAEEALRRSEADLRLVFDAAQVGIVFTAADGRILLCNPYLLNLVGLTENDLLGKRAEDLNLRRFNEDGSVLLSDDVPSRRAALTKQDVRDKLIRIEVPDPPRSLWLMLTSRPCLTSTGDVDRVITTLTDVTERMSIQAALRETNEALRRSETELQIIFESASFGMALVGPSGQLVRTNLAFQKILGYSEAEFACKTLGEIAHPSDVALTTVPFYELVEGKRDGFRVKQRYVRKGGDICWVWLATSALRDAQGRFRYGISMVEDITQQELAEHSLRELSVRMLRMQQEEQRRIAREIHDSTCQELAAVALNLGAIVKSDRGLSRQATKRVAESLDLVKKVSREMRTFSYLLHPPMLEDFGLWAATRSFVSEFSNRSGLVAKLQIPQELEQLRLSHNSEIALFRFFQEALANVHRHSESKTVSIRIVVKGGQIRASVGDKGRGIPVEVLRQLKDCPGRLAGIGLNSMRERVREIGGYLEIKSDRRGTVVTAIVPMARMP